MPSRHMFVKTIPIIKSYGLHKQLFLMYLKLGCQLLIIELKFKDTFKIKGVNNTSWNTFEIILIKWYGIMGLVKQCLNNIKTMLN
jgi:hypothetical protein